MNSKTRSFRPSPAMFVACIALFIALAGSAVAAGVVGKNSVGSPQIIDAGVRNADLHNGSVGTSKISPAAVGASQIAEGAVGTLQVATDSLGANDLSIDSVGSSELQAGAVRASELGPITIASNETTIAGGGNATVIATCPTGTTVLSGGGRSGFYQVAIASSYRSGNGWRVDARSGASADTNLVAYAYCLTGGSSN